MFESIKEEIHKSDEYKQALTALVERKLIGGLPNETLRAIEILENDPNAKGLLDEIKKHNEQYYSGKTTFENHGVDSKILTTHMYDESGIDIKTSTLSSLDEKDITSDNKVSKNTFEELNNISVNYEQEKSRIEQEKISSNTL